VLEAEAGGVHPLLLADRAAFQYASTGVAEEVGVGDVAALLQGLGQVEQVLLVAQVPLKLVVQARRVFSSLRLPNITAQATMLPTPGST
jgi:hypothetical protein